MPALQDNPGQYALIGDIATAMCRLIKRALWPLIVILVIETAFLGMSNDAGTTAFALISLGCVTVLAVWAKKGTGLPIIPMLAIQTLVAYGLPIATHNESLLGYPREYFTLSGWEVFAFTIAMIGSWRIGMEMIPTSSGYCFALQGIGDNPAKLARIGTAMIVSSSAYKLLESVDLLSPLLGLLPGGLMSVVNVLVAAVSACGFFLCAMMLGSGQIVSLQRATFWILLVLQCYISASAFLLSNTITVLFSAAIGFFWGSGKVPWRYLLVALLILSYLNLGKFAMRGKYWTRDEDSPAPAITFGDMPRYYREWMGASWDALTGAPIEEDSTRAFLDFQKPSEEQTASGQSLLERINNLQNLLFVVDVTHNFDVKPVGGASYWVIPPLLVPRALWPDKPRSHQGQILLNVHFGRQDEESTLRTYVAWGLLAEAYGNFGPITGTLLLGIIIGLLFARVEKYVARKLVMSTEGFVCFTVFLMMANSFEMVASVLITSLFQACIPIILASAPLVHRTLARPRGDAAAVTS